MNKNTCTACLLDNTDVCSKSKDKTTDDKICKDFIRLCTKCPEYDTINHNCPLYCKFIRDTLQECLVAELEQTKEEIEDLLSSYGYLDMHTNNDVLEIIDEHIAKLEGEPND